MRGLDICQNINRSGYLTILLLYDIFNIGIYIKLGQYFPKMLKLQLGHHYPNRGSKILLRTNQTKTKSSFLQVGAITKIS